jgi:hypothetical protein
MTIVYLFLGLGLFAFRIYFSKTFWQASNTSFIHYAASREHRGRAERLRSYPWRGAGLPLCRFQPYVHPSADLHQSRAL